MAWIPDFDSLERYVRSVAENPDSNRYNVLPEAYTEHQARMAGVGITDPRWNEHTSKDHKLVRKDGFPWNWLNQDHRHLQQINRINANRQNNASRPMPEDEIVSGIGSTLAGADIKYRREITSNYEGDGNVVFIDCKFQRHTRIVARNITIIGNNGTAPKFIEAEENVVVFGHHFISRIDCQQLLRVGYDFRVYANALEENWISSKEDWVYAENLLETYAESLSHMLHSYRIFNIEIPTAQEILAQPRSRQTHDHTTIRVNDRDYGDDQGNFVRDIASEIIATMFRHGKKGSKNEKKCLMNNRSNNESEQNNS